MQLAITASRDFFYKNTVNKYTEAQNSPKSEILLGQAKLITSLAGLLKKSDAGRGFFYLLFMTKNVQAANLI